ncbi:MAG TPA: TPM domain-containing protein, partial [Candidatus Limnocylindria bacterium]|nr:TPM domain-containing protein [Candidatus Limnocylindria bacterium]
MPALRSVLPALAAALLLIAMVVAPALAQTLSERVVDESGVMSESQIAEAESAITALEDEDNVQLWALYVDTTDGEEVTDYADAVAAENGLGGNDALLVVAIDDRRDALWIGDLLTEVSDQELDLILADRVEPQLRDSEWGAAVAGAAEGLSSALAGDVGPD